MNNKTKNKESNVSNVSNVSDVSDASDVSDLSDLSDLSELSELSGLSELSIISGASHASDVSDTSNGSDDEDPKTPGNAEDDTETEVADSEVADSEVADSEVADSEGGAQTDTETKTEDCMYKYIDEDESGEQYNELVLVPDDERITTGKLTKYERVRILGLRAKQIAMGAKVLVKYDGTDKSPEDLARLELKHKMSPVLIRRVLPNKRYEIWKLDELVQVN
jgi:DNA-directed RNA polymerase I, II, and III subunit RPABC2